jgi:hypothetical protein
VTYIIGESGPELPAANGWVAVTFLARFCPVCNVPVIGRDEDNLNELMFDHLNWDGTLWVDGEWKHHDRGEREGW